MAGQSSELMFGVYLLLQLLVHPGQIFLPVAGHEDACLAEGQSSERSSSLIQGVSWTYRGSLKHQAREEAAKDPERPQLPKIPHAHADEPVQGQSSQEPSVQHSAEASSHNAEHSASSQRGVEESIPSKENNATSNKWAAPHRLVSLLQHRSPGSIGAILFVTAIFFILGVVLILVLAINPPSPHPDGSYQYDDETDTPGDKVAQRYLSSQGMAGPPVEMSQNSAISTDTFSRHSGTSVQGGMTPSHSIMAKTGEIKPKVLSPQLVVPADCECALVLRMPTSGWRGSFAISDTRGSAVLQVSIVDGELAGTSGQATLEIQLCSSSTPTSKVARCRLLKAGKIGTFCVYQGESTDLFATVTRDTGGKAKLVLASGGSFNFIREDRDNVRVVDDHDQLHGTSEPYNPRDSHAGASMQTDAGKSCLVRIGPLSDAGLVLCGLLCIHQLHPV